jgi:hypothetical protein
MPFGESRRTLQNACGNEENETSFYTILQPSYLGNLYVADNFNWEATFRRKSRAAGVVSAETHKAEAGTLYRFMHGNCGISLIAGVISSLILQVKSGMILAGVAENVWPPL